MPQKQAGLIFQDHVIRFAGLKNHELKGMHYNEVALPPGVIKNGKIEDKEKCTKILKSALKKSKIRGSKIIFSVPDSSVILRILELPGSLSDNDLQVYFVTELEQKIQLPFEAAVFDFHTISRTAIMTKVVLFAAPEEVVKEYLEVMNQCGIKPKAADLSMLAVERFYHFLDLPADRTDHRMLIQLDESSMTISVFHDDIPLFMRSILLDPQEGEDQREEVLLKASNEISRVLSFYEFTVQKGAGSVGRIYMVGDHPSMISYQDAIESTTRLPVTPLYKSLKREGSEDIPPQYFTAIGLALKQGATS